MPVACQKDTHNMQIPPEELPHLPSYSYQVAD